MALRTGRWWTVGGGLAAVVLTVSAATASNDTAPENDSATLGINDTIFADSFECGGGCGP